MKKTIKTTAAAVTALLTAQSGNAAEISTNTAIMQAMDKITGQVDLIEIPVNKEIAFGSLSIVVRECKTRTPEETPENFAFVDVVDKNTIAGDVNIFKGWMLSSSPALNPVAHPVYDVWLLKCADKQVDKEKLMSKEQLEERDNIIMSRDATEKALGEPEQEISQETPFSQATDGEPINLIPDEVSENSSDVDSLAEAPAPVAATEQAAAPASETEEGAPQALIDFSATQSVETVSEEITQDADFETIDIAPEKEQAPSEPANFEPSTEKNNVIPENDSSKERVLENTPVEKTETETLKEETQISAEDSQENKPAENSEDIINKLEQELSAQLIGE